MISKQTKFFIGTHFFPAIFLLLWIGANIAVFTTAYLSYNHKKYYYINLILGKALPIARASAACLNLNNALILIPVCKNVIESIRKFINLKIFPRNLTKLTDEAIHFHKIVAYSIFFFTAVHYYSHCFNLERYNNAWLEKDSIQYNLTVFFTENNYLNPLRKHSFVAVLPLWTLTAGWSGVIITASLVMIFASSVEFIRCKYFEIFWFTHHFFIFYFVFQFIHGMQGIVRSQVNWEDHDPSLCQDFLNSNSTSCPEPIFEGKPMSTWKWILGPIALYLFERLIRIINSVRSVEVMRIVEHPNNVMEINMRKRKLFSKKYVRGEVGQYISLKCPSVSILEWHPFTLTSAPETDFLSVYVRNAGDWTGALHKYLKNCSKDNIEPTLSIDGPFGASSQDVFAYKKAVCIGLGIGITPFASLLNSLKCKLELNQTKNDKIISKMKLKKLTFIWYARYTKELEWFLDCAQKFEEFLESRNAKVEDDKKFHCQIQFYVTGDMSKTDISHIVLNETNERDIITNLKSKTYYKRPNWDVVLGKVARDYGGRIGIFYCGSKLAIPAILENAEKYTDEKTVFEFHKENF